MFDHELENGISKLEIAGPLQEPQYQVRTLVDLPIEIIEQIAETLCNYPEGDNKDWKFPLHALRLSSAKFAAKTQRAFCNRHFKALSATSGKELFDMPLKLAGHQTFRLYVKTFNLDLKAGPLSEGVNLEAAGMIKRAQPHLARFTNLTELKLLHLGFQFRMVAFPFRFQHLASLTLQDAIGEDEDFIHILKSHLTLQKVDFSFCSLWHGCWSHVLGAGLLLSHLRTFELYKAKEIISEDSGFAIIYASSGNIEYGKPECLLISNGANYYTIAASDKHGMHASLKYMMHHHTLRDHPGPDDTEDS